MIDNKVWLGSGFAGPYLFDAAIGSRHSQYVDVLFRTGPIRLVLYLGLWGCLSGAPLGTLRSSVVEYWRGLSTVFFTKLQSIPTGLSCSFRCFR